MCFCSHGKEFGIEEQFDWSIISHEYIDYQDSYYKKFRDFHGGKVEMEFAKNIEAVKQEVQKKHPKTVEKPSHPAGQVNNARFEMRQQMISSF